MGPRPLGDRSPHHIRDVTYGEDASQVHTGNGPQAMAALRNLTTAIHKLAGARNIAAACRHHARDAIRVLATLGLSQHDQGRTLRPTGRRRKGLDAYAGTGSHACLIRVAPARRWR